MLGCLLATSAADAISAPAYLLSIVAVASAADMSESHEVVSPSSSPFPPPSCCALLASTAAPPASPNLSTALARRHAQVAGVNEGEEGASEKGEEEADAPLAAAAAAASSATHSALGSDPASSSALTSAEKVAVAGSTPSSCARATRSWAAAAEGRLGRGSGSGSEEEGDGGDFFPDAGDLGGCGGVRAANRTAAATQRSLTLSAKSPARSSRSSSAAS